MCYIKTWVPLLVRWKTFKLNQIRQAVKLLLTIMKLSNQLLLPELRRRRELVVGSRLGVRVLLPPAL